MLAKLNQGKISMWQVSTWVFISVCQVMMWYCDFNLLSCLVEKVPLQAEPPLDVMWKLEISIQLADITPEWEALSVHDIVGALLLFVCKLTFLSLDQFDSSSKNNEPEFYHKLPVMYLPAVGLSPEELLKYSVGVTHSIPNKLFSIYPSSVLYFKSMLIHSYAWMNSHVPSRTFANT